MLLLVTVGKDVTYGVMIVRPCKICSKRRAAHRLHCAFMCLLLMAHGITITIKSGITIKSASSCFDHRPQTYLVTRAL